MLFLQVTKYFQQSQCKRYGVAAAKNGDDWAFTAWHGKDSLGSYRTADEARDRCRAHEQTRVEA